MIKDKKIDSFIYNFLLKHYRPESQGIRKEVWDKCWNYACANFSGPVSTNIHGKLSIINFGHSYQLYARRFKGWNNPLVELAYLCFKTNNTPITVIDVGASIGDTVRLLESNCPNMIEHFICIEGEPDFFSFLKQNLADPNKYILFNNMLSDENEEIPSLIRSHPGTASALGNTTSQAVTLDSLIIEHGILKVDLLKVDVDGYDGKILKGSEEILKKFHPAVIFEWDPFFCKKTNNNWQDHFSTLNKLGYNQYIWFSKYGDFSHFMTVIDEKAINQMAQVCLSDEHDWNWHYDIVALHDISTINTKELAVMNYAKSRLSWY